MQAWNALSSFVPGSPFASTVLAPMRIARDGNTVVAKVRRLGNAGGFLSSQMSLASSLQDDGKGGGTIGQVETGRGVTVAAVVAAIRADKIPLLEFGEEKNAAVMP
jgi:hypothetical protein